MIGFVSKKNSYYLLIVLSLFVYYYFGYELERSNFFELITTISFLFLVFYQFVYKLKVDARQLLVLGLVFRGVLFFQIPNLSQDFYRFIWDGRMLFNGLNPFLTTPLGFIEQNVSPVNQAQELFNGMGKLNASHYTNYPPVSQFCYWLAALFGSRSILISVIVFRLQIILADVGVYFFGKKILSVLGLSEKNIFLYFLNPFVIIELTGNLHFEAVMAFFLVWSLYLLLKGNWVVSAIVFSLSVSTKLIPLLFLPVFFYFFNRDSVSFDKLKFSYKGLSEYVLFCFLVILGLLITFIPFLNKELILNFSSSVGLWFTNFEFNASVYYLIRWLGFQFVGWNIIGVVGKILPVVVFLCVILLSLCNKNFKPQTLFSSLLFSICVYLLFSTTVHPWYLVIPLIISVFTNFKFVLLWTFMVFISYKAYAQNGFNEQLIWVALEYLLVISLFVYEYFFRKKKVLVIVK